MSIVIFENGFPVRVLSIMIGREKKVGIERLLE